MRPGAPDAKAMAHVPITGTDSSLVELARLPGRTLYIHMNNTNPVLRPDSEERRAAEKAGWTIGQDGMEVSA